MFDESVSNRKRSGAGEGPGWRESVIQRWRRRVSGAVVAGPGL
jgi:hypothetical protein